MCIICHVPAQIPDLENFFSPEIWAKMLSANQIVGSLEEIDEVA